MVTYTQIDEAQHKLALAEQELRDMECQTVSRAIMDAAYHTVYTCMQTVQQLKEQMSDECMAWCEAEAIADEAAAVMEAELILNPMPVLNVTADDASRHQRHAGRNGNRCLACNVYVPMIDMEERRMVCPSCAWSLVHRDDFGTWPIDVQRVMITGLNALCGKG